MRYAIYRGLQTKQEAVTECRRPLRNVNLSVTTFYRRVRCKSRHTIEHFKKQGPDIKQNKSGPNHEHSLPLPHRWPGCWGSPRRWSWTGRRRRPPRRSAGRRRWCRVPADARWPGRAAAPPEGSPAARPPTTAWAGRTIPPTAVTTHNQRVLGRVDMMGVRGNGAWF